MVKAVSATVTESKLPVQNALVNPLHSVVSGWQEIDYKRPFQAA